MSEIKTNKRVAKIMPGRDTISGDLKAYDLQNTIITGVEGSGVSNVINNIVMHLVQDYSPNELGIQYFPLFWNEPWVKKSRRPPHFKNQVYFECMHIMEYRKLLFECFMAVEEYERNYEEGMLHRMNVIILELDNKCCEYDYVWNIVKALVQRTYACPYVKVILLARSNSRKLEELEPYITLRLLTRTNEDLSNTFLGCNLASLETDKYGFVWVAEKAKFDIKQKLSVDFKPDTFYNKLCKYLSSNVDTGDDAYSFAWSWLQNPECDKTFEYRRFLESFFSSPEENFYETGYFNKRTDEELMQFFYDNAHIVLN